MHNNLCVLVPSTGELLTIAETPKAEATAADDVLDEPPKPKYLLRRRESRDDNFLGTKSAHLEVKPTISKAVSLVSYERLWIISMICFCVDRSWVSLHVWQTEKSSLQWP